MTERSEAKRVLYRELRAAMKDRGFTKVAGTQRFVRQLGDGVEGQVGFADATKQTDDTFWVDPSIGACVQEVERLIAAWTMTDAGWTTLYCNVGYLPPREGWRESALTTVADVPTVMAALLADIDAKGAEFFENCTHPGYLADLLDQGVPMVRSEERLPILRALAGDEQRAIASFSDLESKVAASLSPSLRSMRYVEGYREHFRDLFA